MSKKTTTVEVLLTASGKGLVNTFSTGRKGVAAFNKEVGNGTKLIGEMRNQLFAMGGAFAGFQAIGEVNQLLQDASLAAFNLEDSLRAANRQFEVGSAGQWAAYIDQLSKKLRIYSETDLRNASSRTIDMTKRLGLSAEQMRTVIELTGDLSAGKTDLEGGIERVTSALRGEAEASEYLGLTLNENYVKGWHEAHNAHNKAWKDLTDLEKAQVRYNVFLEQAVPLQGRAARSVDTYGGAIALVKKEIADGIGKNEDLIESLKHVAKILNENADELGELASSVATGAAVVIEFVAANRDMVVEVGKWTLLFGAGAKMIGLVATNVRGLNAALVAMSGMNILTWLKGLGEGAMVARAGVVALAGTAGGMAVTMAALPGVVAASTVAVVKAAQEFIAWRDAVDEAEEAEKRMLASEEKFAVTLKRIADETGVVIKSSADFGPALRKGLVHYDEFTGKWKKGAKEMAEATTEQASTIKQVTGAALEEMKKKYKEYADEISRLQDQIAGREQSLAEQLRAMSRSGMSDLGAWKDRKREAEEYEEAARRAMEAGNYDEAVKLADKAKSAYADLNKEVKDGEKVAVSQQDALKIAMSGVEDAGKLAVDALKAQQDAAAKAMDELTKQSGFADLAKGMDDSKRKWLDNWLDMRTRAIKDIDAVEDRLLAIKDKDVTVYINEKTTSGYRTGGRVPGYRTGGRFPGPTTPHDNLLATVVGGEGFTMPEALRIWDSKLGPGFFDAINDPWSPAGRNIMERMTSLPFNLSLPEIKQVNHPAGGRSQEVTMRFVDEATGSKAILFAKTEYDAKVAQEIIAKRNKRLSSI